ncbi:lysine--tRNA ligase [Candidatus Azambacteria bacterium RIFCSPHIGHO2_02_FULL_52_12]|uniref:Lysine--tRNA ligase n=1 Tax=Candidatus Azambacteria bacterium RIFCSPLOWO2_01_FULL_46_25 TaxID=1797298 RepID=A0A1F5BTN5_9BACT|nr:MAG: lysine--tRNA ligase [Candidatus Azambacteria bacterium RIFCSPHIGHO2_02_FULL_52_12]OGD33965.1 MAG: lysine--tRNA ligase [Candidatus Azambacteria bacterium RIFCSPLOWO2_01_FULL_46_25]OGD37651.1 MAG: lysine--tRNA ligase [Candidatus Azambacteria bacterium RIFCSPHIGHO2_01_FULL_51_74]
MRTGLAKVKKVKLQKIEALAKSGVAAYPDIKHRPTEIAEVKKRFDELVISQKKVRVAGRIMAKREHGGSTFVSVNDGSGTLQLYMKQDLLGVDRYQFFLDYFDVGDFVESLGPVFITRRGEQTQEAHEFSLLAKAVAPLPEKWHGLADVDERYRKRYLDLLMNEDVRAIFLKRSRAVKAMRDFLEADGFLEVETPILQTIPGGAIAEPFKTRLNALRMDLYLRVAPELYLKRLLVGGFPKVYEIGRCFRNEGMDATHNPDFTMMECYEAYANYEHMMERVERMVRFVVQAVLPDNHLEIERDGKLIDFKSSFDVAVFSDLLKRHAHIDYDAVSAAELAKKAKELKITIPKGAGKGKIADEIYKTLVRPNILQPTFMIHHPLELSPLAKQLPGDASKVARFQLVAAGMEIANGYSELNDPAEQAERFRAQEKTRTKGDKEAQRMDKDFIEALEYGMPPAAGLGVGVERLVALLTGAHSIREVMLFPTMRPKK